MSAKLLFDCAQARNRCQSAARERRMRSAYMKRARLERTSRHGATWLRVLLTLALALCVVPDAHAYTCPQSPPPARTETYQGFLGRVYQQGDEQLPYRLFVPKDYDANEAYPLVLYLHHAGLAGTDSHNESGWDNCVQLTSEIGSGDDYGGVFTHRAVDKDGNRFDTQQRYPHFVLAPHANSPAYGFGGGGPGSATAAEHPTRALLLAIIEQVQAEFNIDPGRLYVTGISMGCYGTWDIIMRKPGMFAAASPQSCRGDPNQALLAALKDTPIWSMCGTNDSYFSGAQAMAEGMEAVGATAFTFTAMQGVGHSINDRGYDYPGFIDWMFAQRLPGVEPPDTAGTGGAAGASAAGAAGAAGTAFGGQAGQSMAGTASAVGGAMSGLGGSAQGVAGAVTPGATPSSADAATEPEASCAMAAPRAAGGSALVLLLGLAAASWHRRARNQRAASSKVRREKPLFE
jgi:dienelactone hydrolase